MRGEGSAARRPWPVPREGRRDEDQHLVDEVGLEERRGERRPTLEQQRLDALVRERAQLLGERPGPELEVEPVRERPSREDEPPRLALRRLDVACVEPRPVGARRAAADGDRVDLRAQLVHASAALLAGHPALARAR